MVDLKHNLYVNTALSAGAQCLPGAVYWTRADYSSMKYVASYDVVLSIQWSVGLNP